MWHHPFPFRTGPLNTYSAMILEGLALWESSCRQNSALYPLFKNVFALPPALFPYILLTKGSPFANKKLAVHFSQGGPAMNLDYLDLDSQLVSQPFRWLVDLLGDVLKPDIPTWDLRPQGLEVVPTSLLRHDAKDIEISARWSCASRMRLRGRFVVSGYDWKPLWIHVRLPHVISPPCGQRFRNTFIVDGTDSTSPWRLYPKDGTSCYEYLNQRCESIFGPRLPPPTV